MKHSHFDLGFRSPASPGSPQPSTRARSDGSTAPASRPAPSRGHFPFGWQSVLLSLIAFLGAGTFFLGQMKTKGLSKGPAGAPTALLALTALAVLAVVIGLLSALMAFLRRLANPLYWQVACWFLMALGLLLRPLVVSGTDPLQTTVKGALVAGLVALGVFPGLMRVLNRLRPEPGLGHVALPFALGFFLDVAQLAAKTHVPALSWLH